MADLLTRIENATNATSVEDLWAHHLDAMTGHGFDRLLYGFTRYRAGSSLGDPQDWVVLTNHNRAYVEPFLEDGLVYHAPMLRWALANDGACSWRWMAEPGNLTPAEQRVAEFNASLGVTAGYTISFRSVSERAKGAIALTAKRGITQDKVEQIWAERGREIHLLNNILHLKLQTLPYSGQRSLTKRQREVLQWVGDGKTTQDIALLLGLTPATIEKHLRLAREALDVETTAQAVLKAAFYNQMFVLDA